MDPLEVAVCRRELIRAGVLAGGGCCLDSPLVDWPGAIALDSVDDSRPLLSVEETRRARCRPDADRPETGARPGVGDRDRRTRPNQTR